LLQGILVATQENVGGPVWLSNNQLSFNNAGNMPPGGKARITYLNLPTQIFDPANIGVKAKAVHGN
jgi:hypothetical protein